MLFLCTHNLIMYQHERDCTGRVLCRGRLLPKLKTQFNCWILKCGCYNPRWLVQDVMFVYFPIPINSCSVGIASMWFESITWVANVMWLITCRKIMFQQLVLAFCTPTDTKIIFFVTPTVKNGGESGMVSGFCWIQSQQLAQSEWMHEKKSLA